MTDLRARGLRLAASCLALLMGLAPLAARPAAAGVYYPETFTLANGMQVVVVTNRRVPVVTHMVWYKVGAADEPAGKSGMAHFLEHLMFRGTAEIGPGEFSKRVAQNGGVDNAFTSYDYTAFFEDIAAAKLPMVMAMEADRMTGLKLSPELFEAERKVVLDERRQRSENTPGDRLSEQVNATFWINHPYGRPVIGWETEIKALSQDDVMGFYHQWYTPNNAVLVVSGDIDAEQLRPMAEATYGRIPGHPVPERHRTEEPDMVADRNIVLRDREVLQPEFVRHYRAPSYNTASDAATPYALQLLSEILSGGQTGRMYRQLVVEKQLATDASSYYSPSRLDGSSFSFAVTPAAGTTLDTVQAALDGMLRELAATGVTAAEVETAKQRMAAAAIFARDSLGGPPRSFGAALTTGRSAEDVEAWPDRMNAVTVAQVNDAARAMLAQRGLTNGLLLPDPTAAAIDAAQNGVPAATPGGTLPNAGADTDSQETR